MVTLGQPIEDVTAPAALTGLLRASAGHVQWLSGEVAALDSLGSHEAEALVKLYDSERDRLARVSEACIRAGVAEAQVRIMEVQATAYVQAIREAAQDAGLNDRQLQALGVALRKRLAGSMADGDPAQVHREQAQADARLAALRAEQEAEDERRVAERAEHRAKELSGLTFPPEELIPKPPEAA